MKRCVILRRQKVQRDHPSVRFVLRFGANAIQEFGGESLYPDVEGPKHLIQAFDVLRNGNALARHAEADHVRLAAGGALGGPGGYEVAAGALVALRPAGGALTAR